MINSDPLQFGPVGRPSPRGNQGGGWKRWARAKDNADRRPSSHGAKLFRSRVDTALTGAAGLADRPWIHMRKARNAKSGHAYVGQTCCTAHALMRLVLDAHSENLRQLDAFVRQENPEYVLLERPADSPRRGACLVCGGDVA